MITFYLPNYTTSNQYNLCILLEIIYSFNIEKYSIININNCVPNLCNIKIEGTVNNYFLKI